jgi:hypothetical protein
VFVRLLSFKNHSNNCPENSRNRAYPRGISAPIPDFEKKTPVFADGNDFHGGAALKNATEARRFWGQKSVESSDSA